MTHASARAAPGTHERDPRRWWTLGVLCLSLLIVGIDNSILNVAIPTLTRVMHASTSDLQWIVDAYVIVFAGLLLTMGSLGDRFGRKGIMTLGLVVFGSASAVGAFSANSTQLIASRAVMGAGAAMIMPATLSILANVFTDARERRRAIAYWTLMNAAATAVGPITGGLLLEHFWWGSVLLVNVPVVIVALILGKALVPTSRDPSAPPVDVPGAALSIVGLGVLLFAIINGPEYGWASAKTIASFAVAIAVLTVFVMVELRREHPMLPVRYFRDMRLTAAAGTLTIAFVSLAGTMFLLTQVLQLVKGYTPLSAALHVSIPLVLVNFLVMPFSPRLTERFGPKRIVTAGLLSITAGLVAITFTQVGSGYPNLLVGLLLMALGFSVFLPAVTDSIMGVLPKEKAGSGSAINDMTRQIGVALGVGLAGSLAVSAFRTSFDRRARGLGLSRSVLAEGRSSIGAALEVARGLADGVRAAFVHVVEVAFIDGVRLATIVAAVVCILGATFAWLALPARTPHHELNASELFPGEVVVDDDDFDTAVNR